MPSRHHPRELSVLHVDDDPGFLDLTRAYLARVAPDVTVRTATSPADARTILDADPVDCVVSDYDMPRETGLELLATVRDHHDDLPFILFTAKPLDALPTNPTAPFTDYLQKAPGRDRYELLADRIRALTEKHHTERHLQRVYDALDLVDDGVSLIDATGHFTYVTDTYADTFGYDPDELTGEHWTILYRDDADATHMKDHVLAPLEPGDTWHATTRQIRKDGTEILVEHRLRYTTDDVVACLVTELDTDPPTHGSPVVDGERA